ncbi:hypothetical protein [Pseudomonas sp. GL-B-19]|uniref:hypothetical protein n=1 Tax=Pseudomonas sp. GL-B-19 TaxID=2832393 RepID=UPI001CBD7D03|nr:hypothetical protein [Pseudomonas sp. GL-B-19]
MISAQAMADDSMSIQNLYGDANIESIESGIVHNATNLQYGNINQLGNGNGNGNGNGIKVWQGIQLASQVTIHNNN